ncbi:lipopolysaccharide heptosyltransferase II [Zymobacter palmae]|uniref:lipopolysaccharide heptosyltransferase II n=1 Tax=Zymobacter palmae TaxID=33074 RepID=A0A348HB97_9GAMM|nr:lipopolysaccharide heptosyltransferase II [Zymobacter palmae]BBG28899.1 ADP-heptose:LPS heptosyltransferase [Zymobacter palmae]
MSGSERMGKRILIVGPSWVGDMVMAQSLLKILKAQDPQCVIDVLGPAWSAPIIERMPEARRALTLRVGHGDLALRERWRFGRSLKGEYDQAIVLPRSLKSALVPWFAGVPVRVGFTGEQRYGILNQRRDLDKAVLDQTVKRFVSLGLPKGEAYPPREMPFPALRVDADNQARLREALDFAAVDLLDRPLVALMPGAEYGPAKQWPLAHFHATAQALVERGYGVLVLGGPKDVNAGQQVAGELPHTLNLCGKTALADAVDLLGMCEQVVSNDSGLMHVAAAVGVHVQGIYGSSSPRYTPPLTHNADIHWLALDCSPCFKRVCPLGHTDCLHQLSVTRVVKAIDTYRIEQSTILARETP